MSRTPLEAAIAFYNLTEIAYESLQKALRAKSLTTIEQRAPKDLYKYVKDRKSMTRAIAEMQNPNSRALYALHGHVEVSPLDLLVTSTELLETGKLGNNYSTYDRAVELVKALRRQAEGACKVEELHQTSLNLQNH